MRIPYWDWALEPLAGEDILPPEFGEAAVYVYGPNGWQWIANPLFSYKFKPLDKTAFIHPGVGITSIGYLDIKRANFWCTKFSEWTETKRAPDNDGISQHNHVAQALGTSLPAIRQRLFTLFSNYNNYVVFSTKQYRNGLANGSTFDSIENLHDSIHTIIGQTGHMQYIQYSAFDPIFMLHHAMTDRVVAMWQNLYPESWVEPIAAGEPTFTISKGQTQDTLTSLTPFYADSAGRFWNSDMIRDTRTLGYAYEETVSYNDADGVSSRLNLISTINKLYGKSGSGKAGVSKKRRLHDRYIYTTAQGIPSEDIVNCMKTSRDSRCGIHESRSTIFPERRHTEWLINIRVNDGALNGTFIIYCFLGRVPDDSATWPYANTLVGSMSAFTMYGMKSGGQNISGTVPLTAKLMNAVTAGTLSNLDSDATELFLEKNLQYRVVDDNGQEIDPQLVAGLYLGLAKATISDPSSNAELPRWGLVTTVFDIYNCC
jgi:tyrosinase